MSIQRARINILGAVQGVGFRPFVYRLAEELGLTGWVSNSPQGVAVEVEGGEAELNRFRERLEHEKPPAATIRAVEFSLCEPMRYAGFEIRESRSSGDKSTLILPDIATCPDCLQEIFDPGNRRYRYPFTNCTNCGPRFSIIEALPYDRSNTSMKEFAMCPACEAEYHDPHNRRFHAQPNACPECGPQLALWDDAGRTIALEHDALQRAALAVNDGRILAVKGIGGFQLLVDARNDNAVRLLRQRKHRMEKPFAVMFPSALSVEAGCKVGELERKLLRSPQAPIVLLEKESVSAVELAPSVAPGNPLVGAMLPYSPVHYLLLFALEFPVVATSGNLTDEPICIDEREALQRLLGIADLFLVHDRPIVRHMDDSVVRVVAGREMMLRCARGYAPVSISLRPDASRSDESILAVGAQLKNAVALKVGRQAFISQHIGDLETEQAFAAFRTSADDLPRLYDAMPRTIACDLHPEYLSTKFGQQFEDGMTCVGVQHHYAHVLSCMEENELFAPVLGICWDGTGYGIDGTIWGGEFLVATETSFKRVAHFRQFRLPGGDSAVKQPRRSALGMLYEIFGEGVFGCCESTSLEHFSESEQRMLLSMLKGDVNTPLTSSVGRVFDAVAALLNLRQLVSFEGQAAMDVEFGIQAGTEAAYPYTLRGGSPVIIDWQPMILEILDDLQRKVDAGVIAAKFHNCLVEMIVGVAQMSGHSSVALSGGCFQNRYLLEQAVRRLREQGFTPYWHRRIPTNDGGVSFGQLVAATRMRKRSEGGASSQR